MNGQLSKFIQHRINADDLNTHVVKLCSTRTVYSLHSCKQMSDGEHRRRKAVALTGRLWLKIPLILSMSQAQAVCTIQTAKMASSLVFHWIGFWSTAVHSTSWRFREGGWQVRQDFTFTITVSGTVQLHGDVGAYEGFEADPLRLHVCHLKLSYVYLFAHSIKAISSLSVKPI